MAKGVETLANLNQLTIHALRDLLKNGQISAGEVLADCLDRIQQVDSKVKAFITLTPQAAKIGAEKMDSELRRIRNEGSGNPLAGIPMALKDNMCTQGVRTSCGSKILANFVPPYNCTIADKLSQAGSILVGKANMDEFAMGSSTENSGFFATANPWDTGRFQRRVRSRGSSGRGYFCPRLGYWWIYSTAGCFLRGSRIKTYLWSGFSVWFGGLCFIVRPDRAFD
jgi:Asp-tRNA(Asn)/Glu-tRNA(Gln) amidotransferase A subunit family amidase